MTGKVFTHPALARARFARIVSAPEPAFDLAAASLLVALDEYPALDVEGYLSRIDDWSSEIRERIDGSKDVELILESINRFLFEEEGFHGDAGDPYDPRTTFLNEVLDHHAGLPIALSIVYIEISRRLGLVLTGVALPGRFLVKVATGGGEIYIDPFDDGRVLSSAECQAILDQVYGGGVRLREHHLRSVSRREIVQRFLAHLKAMYLAHDEVEKATATIDRLLILDERDAWETRDRGLLAMRLHDYATAIQHLEHYLELAPQAEDRARILREIVYLRSWLDQN
jgi:regulator of sirC expression with transglutaminase-like and TPR domain